MTITVMVQAKTGVELVEAAILKAERVLAGVPEGKCAEEKAYLERLVARAKTELSDGEPVYAEELVAALEEGAKGLSYLAGTYVVPEKVKQVKQATTTSAAQQAVVTTAEVVVTAPKAGVIVNSETTAVANASAAMLGAVLMVMIMGMVRKYAKH